MTLRDQLQSSLGSAYTLDRELGGGGMSRVFVAEERRLGRRVVVKVLSTELAAGLSAERFAADKIARAFRPAAMRQRRSHCDDSQAGASALPDSSPHRLTRS